MKILYLADSNSPIAQNWIRYFVRPGNEIQVITGFRPQGGGLTGVKIHHVPLLSSYFFRYSSTQMSQARTSVSSVSQKRELASNILRPLNRKFGLQTIWKSYIGPLDVLRNRARIQHIADTFRPDLVHGLRIPTEGYAAAQIKHAPLILSTWGNDLTFHAEKSVLSRRFTRGAFARATGLHTDCQRDIRLAHEYGFPSAYPTCVVPTSGGIPRRSVSFDSLARWRQQLVLPDDAPLVINPRGARSYVCVQEFLQAVPLVLQSFPRAIFLYPAAAGNPFIDELVQKTGIENSVRLLPVVSQTDLAVLFRLADVMVSPTTQDGVPNSLLEAMAQDAFPIASNIDSIREWIREGENGLLIEPTNPQMIADKIVFALGDEVLRERAATINRRLILESADYETCMARANEFYQRVLATSNRCLSPHA